MTIVGDGPLRPELEQRIRELGLEGRVVITGWLSDTEVRERIVGARALILPSFAEGLPVVLMEAAALSRPVIATYVAGIPELVLDRASGWLVPAGNVGRLRDAMRECLSARIPAFEPWERPRDTALSRCTTSFASAASWRASSTATTRQLRHPRIRRVLPRSMKRYR